MKTRKTITIKHTGAGNDIRIPATSENPARDAADILARREFGRRGVVVTFRLDSWSEDGKSHTYEAFIGRSPTAAEARKYGNGITGRNVWIYV
jgi:hypothetical protein